ncbi:hypothetical protein [Psychrilyobacter atlanticus]|uniref:hypothetical protein n=1 Tax=Psychrilyobacter atlanticus TaxID=271091 RepID=UPI000424014C|nr:hypothetical protein [Psychrilyobacter atlanticus]
MNKETVKYTIAEVQQDKLIDLGLDIKDAFIISYLKDMKTWKNLLEKTVNGDVYMWVDYSKLLSYLPALKITTNDVLSRRLKKYQNLGLIKRHLHKNLVYGSYNFIFLEEKFNTLFEFNKIEDTEDEIEEMKKKMGLLGQQTPHPSQKSCGFDSKVASTPSQKSSDNTPIKILPQKDSSSTESNPAAASDETFFQNLKDLLIKNNFKNYNSQTLKNIKNYSKGSLEEVKKVIEFMKLKNKAINSKTLVAILKDGDHKIVEPIDLKKVPKADKVAHMLKITTQDEIDDLCKQIAKSFGYEEYNNLSKSDENIVNTELENIFCRRYNKLQRGN